MSKATKRLSVILFVILLLELGFLAALRLPYLRARCAMPHDAAPALFEQADVKGEEGLKRTMALSVRMEGHRRFVKRIDAATAAYMESRWKDVVRSYADLKLDGYEITPQDDARLKDAFKGIDDDLEMRGRAIVREPDQMGEAKLQADKKWVENMKVLLQSRK